MCAIECNNKPDVSRVLPLPQWKMPCLISNKAFSTEEEGVPSKRLVYYYIQ